MHSNYELVYLPTKYYQQSRSHYSCYMVTTEYVSSSRMKGEE